MRLKYFFFMTLILLATPALAEDKTSTLQEDIAAKVATAEEKSFVTLNAENDLFGGGTDRNYTNGVRLTYFKIGARTPDIFKKISHLVPTFSINKTTSIYYTLGQNLYTPKDITQSTVNLNDRPYAAFLYGAAGLTTITKNHVDEMEATLGVIGPLALGRPVQTWVHENISDSDTPRGWSHQLKNEPGVILSWRRRWPERYSFETFGLSSGVEPHWGITAGNVYTYASGGLSLRLSTQDARWQDDPLRVRPAMPGTGAFITPENKLGWYLFGGVEVRAVARNIFLDGNTFTDSHSVDKKNLVADVSGGIALTYGKTRLSYSLIYRTSEFKRQDEGDVFGSLSLGWRF